MGFFKSIIDSLKLSDDSDYDDYDDYDDYVAAEEEKARLKAEKKAERDAAPKFSIKETLFKKRAQKTATMEPDYAEEAYRADEDLLDPVPVRPAQQTPQRTPLYSNNTVSIQERRSGYMNGTTTFEERYKAREAQMYQKQQPASARTAAPVRQNNASVSQGFPIAASQTPKSTRDALGVTILKPQTFEDAQEICDNLLNGNPIIVNLEGFDPNCSQRLMDFVSGCVYSIGANLHQISGYIFIISPADVDVTGDYNALMRKDGFGVPTFNRR